MPRLPIDAFERFVALGAGRSYAKLAQVLGVSKRSITARATRDGWQQKLAAVEVEARDKSAAKLAETTAAINDRHLRTLRAVQHKALQALTASPMGTAAQAASTLIAAVRAERAIIVPSESGTPAGGSLADLLRAAALVPAARVQEVREQLNARHGPPPNPLAAPPAPAPCTEN